MVTVYSLILAGIIGCERLFEIGLAERNKKAALALGAREFGSGHYYLFFLLHTAWLIGWLYEAQVSGIISRFWYIWFGLFILAEMLRYWCIFSLGPCWNTRILIVPGQVRINRGPYRIMNHPNYLAISVILLSVPLVFEAYITAIIAMLANAVLLLRIRIPIETQALQNLK